MQPEHGPGVPGPHPRERWGSAYHRPPRQPAGRDGALCHHHTQQPRHRTGGTSPGHGHGHGAVHAALLPVREPPSTQPGQRVLAGLLHRPAGGLGRAGDAGGQAAERHGHPSARGASSLKTWVVLFSSLCAYKSSSTTVRPSGSSLMGE